MVKLILSISSLVCLGIGVICYQDEQIIQAYADDYGVSRDNLYALVSIKNTCPKEYSAYFDEYFGICWNDFAVAEWQDDFTDTDVGM